MSETPRRRSARQSKKSALATESASSVAPVPESASSMADERLYFGSNEAAQDKSYLELTTAWFLALNQLKVVGKIGIPHVAGSLL